MSLAKIILCDELERIVLKENFSDNPRRTKITSEYIEKPKITKNYMNSPAISGNEYLIITYGGDTIRLSMILKNISLQKDINYSIIDISSPSFNSSRIRTFINSGNIKCIMILGSEAASKVFNKSIDIAKARCKPFKYSGKEGMVINNFISSERVDKLNLWNDLKTFAKWQNLEILR